MGPNLSCLPVTTQPKDVHEPVHVSAVSDEDRVALQSMKFASHSSAGERARLAMRLYWEILQQSERHSL